MSSKKSPRKKRAGKAAPKAAKPKPPRPKPPTARAIPPDDRPEPVELVATTISEAAVFLGVAPRTLAAWCTEPGFPGTPGGPGRQDGHFPIAAIRTWHVATHARAIGGKEEDPELFGARKLRALNDADRSQVELERELENIADTEEVAGFCRRVVHATKSQLEEIPDRTLARLPAKCSADLRKIIRKAIEQSVAESLNTIAELVAGDQDEADDLPDDEDVPEA